MKTRILFPFFLAATLLLTNVSAQVPACDSIVPTFNVDFTGANAGTSWLSPVVARAGLCCSAISIERCIDFIITTDSATTGITMYLTCGCGPFGAMFYKLDCGPLIPFGQICPVPTPGIHYLTFCKPGNNMLCYGLTSFTDSVTISGKIYNDANSNCIHEAGEPVISGMPLRLLNNNMIPVNTTVSGLSGNYYFHAQPGTYTVEVTSAAATSRGYSLACPLSGQINIPSIPSFNNDFALNCVSGFDLRASMFSSRFRPGFLRNFYLWVSNASCIPASGQAKLVLNDPNISYVNSSVTPNFINGDTLIWNFSNLDNTVNFNVGTVTVLVDSAAIIGDSVCADFFVEPVAGDANPADNFVHRCRVISNAVDPNEKDVEPAGYILPGTSLTYTIQFQNTGTDTAYHVFIVDTLNTNLDFSSFRILAANHPYITTFLANNVVKFSFYNIMLVDSNANEPLSHGWITYEINALTGLPSGTPITNRAGIYFDFNLPVLTNTTLNTIDIPTGIESSAVDDKDIFIFPNPAADQLTISDLRFKIERVEIYDVLGERVLLQQLIAANLQQVAIDISRLKAGIYFCRITGQNINRTFKFVK